LGVNITQRVVFHSERNCTSGDKLEKRYKILEDCILYSISGKIDGAVVEQVDL
jgi:hypothetical protein